MNGLEVKVLITWNKELSDILFVLITKEESKDN